MSPEITDNGGLLECSECNDTWCEHVKQIVLDSKDAVEFWQQPVVSRQEQGLVIPFVPSLNFYVTVDTEGIAYADFSTGGAITARKVTLKVSSGHEEFLCILSPGECRLVIRDALYAMVRGADAEMACHAPGHKYDRQIVFQNHLKSHSGKIAEKASLIINGVCLICHERSGVWFNGSPSGVDANGDFSKDLIPS